MILRFLQPVLHFLKVFSKDNSPQQLASGLSMGTMIGLIPKGNLIAVLLTIVLFAFRFNLGTGLLSIFLVSMFAFRLDPIMHGFGERILHLDSIYLNFAEWHKLPIVPWLSLDNTVVVGGLALGLAVWFPVYHLSTPLFIRYFPPVQAKIEKLLRKKKNAKHTSAESAEANSASVQGAQA